MRLSLIILSLTVAVTISAPAEAQSKRKIKKLFKKSEVVNDHFTGFTLYDLDEQKTIYGLNDDKYYNPASNTKLFTFYASLMMLGDSIPGIRYQTRGDSLIFWATGDPTFLHTSLKGTNALNFLKSSNKNIYFSSGWYQNHFWGAGWPWSDYNDYYQADITELPVMDNVAMVYADGGSLKIRPAYLSAYLKQDSAFHPARFSVQRNFDDNTFRYPAMPITTNFKQEIPWKTSPALTRDMLQDTLKKNVGEIHIQLPANAGTINNANRDSTLRRMLQPSDNFIAEQLLLVCSSVKFGILNKDSTINYINRTYLTDLPDKPEWVDGSGLSRYNLFTPRSIVQLLIKIRDKVGDDDLLHSMMPIGGVAGTIKSAYKTDNGVPFVWAKTGSLSNNHNQSGYITTRKGKHLAFSFMNNNYTRPTAEIRNEMVRVMTYIHENF
ncbi:D-alanyl-D-alanine carboxypeptidase/D-alanyl-D-alanine-endopeptidase [Mucilaginibacter myungsuensis]|uniref:D-alanyl-D-alanine carboxypeptidase n=1 Tax=Mucilaginibacter myungsuensis TaxID=649104 RepID=A0A929KU70_9SPHI|nr:D-alanyl-D-alanine carboxypeptidase [Mucilaginibacter myungsuensis]MBE9661257.1 D-alanyl-D-alanine carboxypeptidase [Mucilaginibacter myungsuensis]MDN3597400.1 D-alanyl-D-alanine carboxypeptidase [Mucilaginibacter myungsuensis]